MNLRCDPVDCRVTDYYGREKEVQSHGRRRKKRSADESHLTRAKGQKEVRTHRVTMVVAWTTC